MRQTTSVTRPILAISCLAVTLFTAPFSRGEVAERATLPAEAASSVSGGTLPLYFEQNLGQTDREAQFVAHGAGYTTFLTSSGPVLAAVTRSAKHDAVRMSLVDAAPDARLVGEEPLDGTVNYLLGSDESKWVTDVPTFASVRWQGVYDGVDVRFHSAGRLLEYDFEVAPGADPGQIRLWFEGQEAASVDESGDLVLKVAGGEIRQQRAVAYQDAPSGRRHVGARYEIGGAGDISLALDDYDPSAALVVDPVFVYNIYIGAGYDLSLPTVDGRSIAVDGSGAAYVAGYVNGTAFPTSNPLDSTLDGYWDAFVTKLSPDGTGLIYSTYLGGDGSDSAHGIAVDASGSAFVAGRTDSTNFPTSEGAWDRSLGSPAQYDGFVAKLSPTGSRLNYSTYLGGDADDDCEAIALDSSGVAYVTGSTDGTFPTTPGALSLPHVGSQEVFVTKVAARGQSLVYSTSFGGSYTSGHAIAVDSLGCAYVAGEAWGPHPFPTTHGAFQPVPDDWPYDDDGVIFKMSPGGDALAYSTYLGASDDDYCYGIALDQDRNAYVTGTTYSIDLLAPNVPGYDKTLDGECDAFVAKLTANGARLAYITYLGGSIGESGDGIAVDSAGNAYLVGRTSSPDYPIRGDTSAPPIGAVACPIVAKFGPTGTTLPYSSRVASTSGNYSRAIALGPEANTVFVAGTTTSTTWPATGFGERSAFSLLVAKIRIVITRRST